MKAIWKVIYVDKSSRVYFNYVETWEVVWLFKQSSVMCMQIYINHYGMEWKFCVAIRWVLSSKVTYGSCTPETTKIMSYLIDEWIIERQWILSLSKRLQSIELRWNDTFLLTESNEFS